MCDSISSKFKKGCMAVAGNSSRNDEVSIRKSSLYICSFVLPIITVVLDDIKVIDPKMRISQNPCYRNSVKHHHGNRGGTALLASL